ncbi:RDD family protein, partial [Streptomyces sp. LNU-CPARS28]
MLPPPGAPADSTGLVPGGGTVSGSGVSGPREHGQDPSGSGVASGLHPGGAAGADPLTPAPGAPAGPVSVGGG